MVEVGVDGFAAVDAAAVDHGTPTNTASERRRALQFHYAPADAARISTEQRMAVFGAEGKSVTC